MKTSKQWSYAALAVMLLSSKLPAQDFNDELQFDQEFEAFSNSIVSEFDSTKASFEREFNDFKAIISQETARFKSKISNNWPDQKNQQ